MSIQEMDLQKKATLSNIKGLGVANGQILTKALSGGRSTLLCTLGGGSTVTCACTMKTV